MERDRPKISVVMPVFNGGRYIEQALDSVLSQTYRGFEIVMVNDGSNDDGHTDGIGRLYQQAHADRFQYLAQANAGVGAALNTGVAAMRGEVFCWLSHDDLFEPEKLERQVDFFARLNKPEAMLISDYRLIDSEGEETARVQLPHGVAMRAPRLPLFRGWVNGCTIFIPKSLFPSSAPFDPQYSHVQDYRLWLELLDRAEMFHQPEMLVRYRVHGAQDSRQPQAVVEGDSLWADMVDRPGPAARAQISGSSWRFFEELREHLTVSNYPAAAAHAAARRDESDDAPIDVILTGRGADPPEAPSPTSPPSRFRVRKIEPGAASLDGALWESSGEYVVVLDAGQGWDESAVARRVAAMQTAGQLSAHLEPDCGGAGVILHRSLISGGFRLPGGSAPLPAPDAREPERLEGDDLDERIQNLKAELEERLRFVSDPRFHAGEPKAIDVTTPDQHYAYPAAAPEAGRAAMRTGERPWAYVASIRVERPSQAALLEVFMQAHEDEAYVLVVDDAYTQLVERRRIAPHTQSRAWLDIADLPPTIRLIVQVGQRPQNGVLELIAATLWSHGGADDESPLPTAKAFPAG